MVKVVSTRGSVLGSNRGYSPTGGAEAVITGPESYNRYKGPFAHRQTPKHADYSPDTIVGSDETVRNLATSGKHQFPYYVDPDSGWKHEGNHDLVGLDMPNHTHITDKCVVDPMAMVEKSEGNLVDKTRTILGNPLHVQVLHEDTSGVKVSTWDYEQPDRC